MRKTVIITIVLAMMVSFSTAQPPIPGDDGSGIESPPMPEDSQNSETVDTEGSQEQTEDNLTSKEQDKKSKGKGFFQTINRFFKSLF